jgi:hypothetical protein
MLDTNQILTKLQIFKKIINIKNSKVNGGNVDETF